MGRALDRRLVSSDCCVIAEIVIQCSVGMNTEYQKRRAISGAIFLSGTTLASRFSPVPVEESWVVGSSWSDTSRGNTVPTKQGIWDASLRVWDINLWCRLVTTTYDKQFKICPCSYPSCSFPQLESILETDLSLDQNWIRWTFSGDWFGHLPHNYYVKKPVMLP